jgi:cytochrome c oxidase subunit I
MSPPAEVSPRAPVSARPAAPNGPTGFVGTYIFSTDHKVIGIQYYLLALAAVIVGVILSVFMRLHLAWPALQFPHVFGGTMKPETYEALMTMHGTLMIFFVLTTAPLGGFGSYLLPIQIGARETSFPRLNMLSFWITLVAFACMISAFFVPGGAPLSGWTAYAPLSSIGQVTGPGEGLGQTMWIISIAIFSIGVMLTALNFIWTTINRRAPGMTWLRLPLTVWAWFVTSCLALPSFAVLLVAAVMLLLDRLAGTSFFVPAGVVVSGQLQHHSGGSPLLWQHLFWFFGHPEVYITILPAMGVTSHVLSTFSRKPIFGYRVMVGATCAIGVLALVLWGHHMFVSGMNPYSAVAFSVSTLAVGVPSAIETFNWLATLWGGKIQFTTAMLFALAFVSVFVTGGLSGLFLAQPVIDSELHATYYVVAHFHLIMSMAAIFGIFAATYFWFPKMFGRMLNETVGKLHFWFTFVGAYLIFFPMHFVGLAGGIRRYADFTALPYLWNLQPLQRFITWAALVTASAQLLFLWNLFWSVWRGEKAANNPWRATTLEWAAPSPAQDANFPVEGPRVYRGPYEFSVPGEAQDFVMQNDAGSDRL